MDAKLRKGIVPWESVQYRSKGRLGSDLHIGCDHCWYCAHWNGGTLDLARRKLRAQVKQAIRTERYDDIPDGIGAGYQD